MKNRATGQTGFASRLTEPPGELPLRVSTPPERVLMYARQEILSRCLPMAFKDFDPLLDPVAQLNL